MIPIQPMSLFPLGKFTRETDVWSFGVTLWEIFSFARESPYAHLQDPQMIEIACEVLQNNKRTFPYLSQPHTCDDDVYDLIKKCWTTQPKSRPSFHTLCTQLLQKCTISEVEIWCLVCYVHRVGGEWPACANFVNFLNIPEPVLRLWNWLAVKNF